MIGIRVIKLEVVIILDLMKSRLSNCGKSVSSLKKLVFKLEYTYKHK